MELASVDLPVFDFSRTCPAFGPLSKSTSCREVPSGNSVLSSASSFSSEGVELVYGTTSSGYDPEYVRFNSVLILDARVCGRDCILDAVESESVLIVEFERDLLELWSFSTMFVAHQGEVGIKTFINGGTFMIR